MLGDKARFRIDAVPGEKNHIIKPNGEVMLVEYKTGKKFSGMAGCIYYCACNLPEGKCMTDHDYLTCCLEGAPGVFVEVKPNE